LPRHPFGRDQWLRTASSTDEQPRRIVNVHDRNPRAMTKHVKGFVSAQSWFQDFTRVYME
jgi:hypothetical protein